MPFAIFIGYMLAMLTVADGIGLGSSSQIITGLVIAFAVALANLYTRFIK